MSTNAVRQQEEGRFPPTPLSASMKSDDDTLAQEVRNFITELEKLKVRQTAVEGKVQEQEVERNEVVAQVKE